MKITIKSLFENSNEEITIWVDEDEDINFKIGNIRVCVDQYDLKEAIKFANKNPEEK